jgi:hypothetical protein
MRFGSTALATGRVERRLAAILAADVAGYSPPSKGRPASTRLGAAYLRTRGSFDANRV